MESRLHRTAPQPPPNFRLSPAQIIDETTTLIERLQALQYDITARVTPATATFDNVLLPQIRAQNELECHRGVLTVYAVQPGLKDEFDAARRARQMIQKFEAEAGGGDVLMYKLVDELMMKYEEAGPDILDSESLRYLQLTHAGFIRNGAGISEPGLRKDFQEIQEEIRTLKEACQQENIHDKSGIWLHREEVEGLPDDITGKWEEGSGEQAEQLRLRFSRANVPFILSHLKDERVRRKIFIAHENIQRGNVDRLARVLTLRDSAARMIGYRNHACAKLEDTMAGNPEAVADFLDRLRTKLIPLMRNDLDVLGSLKREVLDGEEEGEGEEEAQGAWFYLWDWPYYNLLREKGAGGSGFDEEAFSEFFPLERTVGGILDMLGEVMGMSFEKISGSAVPVSAVWHPEVVLYEVWDADQESEFLGYLYLDLVEREGKSRGEAHTRVHPGFEKSDGTRHYPASSVRCSFPQPTEEKPTLLTSRQLCNLIHEIAHGVHNLVSRTRYGWLHGTNVSRDLVEIPSILLESWAWHPQSVNRISFHYARLSTAYLDLWRMKKGLAADGSPDPPLHISDSLLDGLLQSRYQKGPRLYLTQVHYSLYDLMVHNPSDHADTEGWNLTRIWNSTKKEVLLLDGPEAWGGGFEWGFGQAKFGKLFTCYDVGYYSYPWSTVIAADLFKEVFKSDPMNSAAGRHLRKRLLEPGRAKPEAEMVKDCLGRDFGLDAFMETLST